MKAYAELHAWSNFTFLAGGSHPEELADRAAELGLTAIALTDRDGLYAAVRFATRAKARGIAAIVGSELTFEDASRIVLLVEDACGYANLCELISTAQLRGGKGDARLRLDDIEGRCAGLIALSGGACGRVERALDLRGPQAAGAEAARLRDLFADCFYLELQHHLTHEEARRNEQLAAIGAELGIPLVATNGVVYADRAHAMAADVLTCVKEGTTLDAARADHLLRPNAEYHLKAPAAMGRLFARYPQAIQASVEIARRCTFRLERLTGQFPHFPAPHGATHQSYLRELVRRGAAQRYGTPLRGEVERQIEYELGIIAKTDLAGYFLIVWDIVRKAEELGVLCQGRGSAANSAVCYALGITAVDPIGMGLLFERFMSEERREIPDIDIDFAHQDREKIIQYVYQRYGRSNAAMAAEVITYRTRSALRDVGKAIGLSLAQVETVAREFDARESLAGVAGERLYELCQRIDGFPRHMGIHSGGMVLTRDPLVRVAPVEWATMRDRTIVQWDKDDLQALGLIKIDLLGLGMLSLLREAFSLHRGCVDRGDAWLEGGACVAVGAEAEACASVAGTPAIFPSVEKSLLRSSSLPPSGLRSSLTAPATGAHASASAPAATNREKAYFSSHTSDELPAARTPATRYLALHAIPPDDGATYEMMRRADTIGVFQIESRAQQSMLPRMKPACFYDIVMQVAIIRPGPIQGQMIHPFLRRRAGLEPVTYPHPKLKAVLERTMGVPLFQEQGMRLAIEAAGFTPGEADELRRAMGHKRSHDRMRDIYPRLVDGMVRNGIDREAAQRLFSMLEGFADYGFPESHAASFALLAYASAYVKCRYPAVFAAAILNVQPMGFYSTEVLVNDARRHGVIVRPVEVNASGYWSCVERDGALRLGFHLVRGLGEKQRERLEAALGGGAFADLLAFAQRTGLEKEALENLAVAGAFAPWYASRREAMWALRAIGEREARGGLGRLMEISEPPVRLAPLTPKQETAFDLWSTGVTPKGQAVAHFRLQLQAQGVVPAARLAAQPALAICRIGGLVITRQRPGTAKGFVFLTLEDETGLVNVIVRPDVYERFRRTIRTASMLVVEGKLQKEAGCIDVLAARIWAFDGGKIAAGVRPRNFH